MELARGWRFACSCTRCQSELLDNPACADGEPIQKDESKVEEPFMRTEMDESASGSLDP
jgi:mitochondrial import receptor subunit TOM20